MTTGRINQVYSRCQLGVRRDLIIFIFK